MLKILEEIILREKAFTYLTDTISVTRLHPSLREKQLIRKRSRVSRTLHSLEGPPTEHLLPLPPPTRHATPTPYVQPHAPAPTQG